MQDLRLIGVHEDGEHLLLSDGEGLRFRLRVDEPLRAAIRRDRPRLGQLQIEMEGGLRPRDVQAMIRAGASAEEVADRAGWSVDKVHRYEGPIVAERQHVAGLARNVRLRGRSGSGTGPGGGGGAGSSGPQTLAGRIGERLQGRGVDPATADWDSWRADEGPWTVVVTFAAGGRQRQASWHFDLADRTVSAVDDEARWLSEDEQPSAGPIPAPHLASAGVRTTRVYDVEAEGGLRPAVAGTDPAGEDPLDLMTAMRERSTARGRRKSGQRRGSRKTPTNLPGPGEHVPDEALPLDDLAYDPETMPLPPAAHAHPEDPDPLDARPEPEAAQLLAEEPDALTDEPEPLAEEREPLAEEREPLAEEREPLAEEREPLADALGTLTVEAEPRIDEPEPRIDEPEPRADEAEPANDEAELPAGEARDAAASVEAQDAAPEVTDSPSAAKAAQPADTAGEESDRPRRPARSTRKGRPSVPSWDDIMFGARPGGDR